MNYYLQIVLTKDEPRKLIILGKDKKRIIAIPCLINKSEVEKMKEDGSFNEYVLDILRHSEILFKEQFGNEDN